jgi:hypothetical protein
MTTNFTRTGVRSALALAIAIGMAASSAAHAQLGAASAAALGRGDVRTPIARGFDAIAANPAGLGMPGSGRFTLALLPALGGQGAGPVTMRDVQRFEGKVIDDATKRLWADRVRAAGAEHVDAGGELTWFAMSIARFGVQLSTTAEAVGSLTPDAVQVLLFGNAGETGEPGRYSLSGSEFTGMVTHTAAVSYAQPITIGRGENAMHVALGATVKYVRGLALAHGREMGGVLGNAPLDLSVQFPVVSSTVDGALDDNGHGIGVDLGAAWESGRWKAGLAVQNAVSTFAWDASKFTYRKGSARFTSASSSSDFDERPLDQAPSELAAVLDRATFDPTIAFGLAVELPGRLLVGADVRDRVGDAIAFTPKMHAGLGAEWRALGWLPLRGGFAALTGGHQASGGAGLRLGALGIDAGIASRTTDGHARTLYAVSLSLGAQ